MQEARSMIYVNISNTYSSMANTGIQRVVREIFRRLYKSKDFSFIVYDQGKFYHLDEQCGSENFLNRKKIKLTDEFKLSKIKPGDIFFDIDASWGDPYEIDEIFKFVKKNGAGIYKMHFDAVPILFPEYSHPNTVFRYAENFFKSMKYVDRWICISKTVKNDLIKISGEHNLKIENVKVLDLGAEIKTGKENVSDRVKKISDDEYIICVGTIEPRKNYDLVIDVFDEIIKIQSLDYMKLVIVGKAGWNNEAIINRITSHPEYDERLIWLDNANDSELSLLYEKSIASFCLSHYEGYGLPLIEALSRGVFVIYTKGTSLEEVANGFGKPVEPTVESVMQALLAYLNSQNDFQLINYTAKTWNDTCHDLIDIFQSDSIFMGKKLNFQNKLDAKIRQAVIISIRPEKMLRLINSIREKCTFLTEAIILTSDIMYKRMFELMRTTGFKIKLIKESDLNLTQLPGDHLRRNTYLRMNLYNNSFVDDDFIAMDDDSIIVDEVRESDFIDDHRHIGYYFKEDGQNWLGAFPMPTSFDEGIFRTINYLKENDLTTYLFNSHQPQIINKNISNIVLPIADKFGLDEWSSYFNIGKHLFPENFKFLNYITAGWPIDSSNWLPTAPPEKVKFFNDFPENSCLDLSQNLVGKWLLDIESEIINRDLTSPRGISLNLCTGGLFFSSDTLNSFATRNILIPIISSEIIEYIKYKFTSIVVEYSFQEVPNFIHIPVDRLGGVKNFLLEVEVRIKNQGLTKKAFLNIFLK